MAVALTALAVIALCFLARTPTHCSSCCPPPTPGSGSRRLATDARLRALLYVGGLAGPLLVLASTALRFGLGLDTPWYLAELTALGYVSAFTFILVLAWAAVAAQVLAVTTGRYAPYPSAEARAIPRARSARRSLPCARFLAR